jgi:hypothetical protein
MSCVSMRSSALRHVARLAVELRLSGYRSMSTMQNSPFLPGKLLSSSVPRVYTCQDRPCRRLHFNHRFHCCFLLPLEFKYIPHNFRRMQDPSYCWLGEVGSDSFHRLYPLVVSRWERHNRIVQVIEEVDERFVVTLNGGDIQHGTVYARVVNVRQLAA